MLKMQVENAIKNAVAIASEKYNFIFTTPKIEYGLRGAVAGRARGGDLIKLHEVFLDKYKEEYINDTVLHELAHCLAYQFGDYMGHGAAWKSMVRAIGGIPKRYHNYDIDLVQKRTRFTCSNSGEQVILGPRQSKWQVSGKRKYNHKGCAGFALIVAYGGT